MAGILAPSFVEFDFPSDSSVYQFVFKYSNKEAMISRFRVSLLRELELSRQFWALPMASQF